VVIAATMTGGWTIPRRQNEARRRISSAFHALPSAI
jgi:hypothetical protein